jgi:outer membrane protein
MKIFLKITALFFLATSVNAANLSDVYRQALANDPVYQQAVAQRFATNENVPINLAPMLPQAGISGGPLLNKSRITGIPDSAALSTTSRGYSFTLSLSQTVFNYAQFKAFTSARATGRQADAALFAATQNLMLRVAQAYFAVLKDEDNLRYNILNKKAFQGQLDQINQQFKVGMKTQTDFYTAQASYDLAAAGLIAAQTTLANDKENLRAITGLFYPTLDKLNEHFPLLSPTPANMGAWVETAVRQNWSVKAAQYANQAAMENIKQQNGGHYPTLSLQGSYNISYSNTLGNSATTNNTVPIENAAPIENDNGTLLPGSSHSKDASLLLNIGVPLFQGGLVAAQTNQAKYNYQYTSQQLEQAIRTTVNNTRQSYLGIILGIKQIEADKLAIKSTYSSYKGLNEGYHIGTQTLVSVLNQQQRLFQAQTQYAADLYAYVNNLLILKQAAGTLSAEDIDAINSWLVQAANDDQYALSDPQLNTHDAEINQEISASAHKKPYQLGKNPIFLQTL